MKTRHQECKHCHRALVEHTYLAATLRQFRAAASWRAAA